MGRVSVRTIRERYEAGDPLTMLTAYDASIARCVDAGGVDMVLVGDSAGDNHLGYDDTLPVTLQEALSNTAAVVRGVEEALVIADMPFLSYGIGMETSLENAGRFLKDADADAVKLETAPRGDQTIELIDRLTELGIPVQGHIGFTPQRVRALGGPVIQGRGTDHSASVDALVETAERLVEAGVFSIVLETMTEEAARDVTATVDVPTIGIGAGRFVDGQVLVVNDVIGLGDAEYTLSKPYASVGEEITAAVEAYVDDVEGGTFPGPEHAFDPVEE